MFFSTNKELIISNLKPLSELYRLLEQESYNFRGKDKNSFISLPNNIDKSLLFPQQIHIRSSELFNTKVIERSKKYLETKRNSIIVKWAKVKDKSALLRT